MKSKQINKNNTTLIRIDSGYHRLLKIKASKSGMSMKTLLEECLSELLAVEVEAPK